MQGHDDVCQRRADEGGRSHRLHGMDAAQPASHPAGQGICLDRSPVVVPFMVAVYCRLFGAEYTYHLQDIHPEAAQIVVPLNRWVFRLLRALDNFTLRHARRIITLSATMRDYLKHRSGTRAPIALLENPAVDVAPSGKRDMDVVFCGNAGRLQRMPLLIAAIKEYLSHGGISSSPSRAAGCIRPISSDWRRNPAR